MRNIKNILIIGHANIGDISCDLAMIKPLKNRFKDAKVYFLTSPSSKGIVEGYTGIEGVIVMDRKKKDKTWGARFSFNKGLWKYRFDLIIVLPRTLMHNFIYTRYVWNIRKDCAKEFISKKVHPIDIYLKYLSAKGLDASEAVFDFNLDNEQAFCDDFFKKNDIKQSDRLVGILPLAALPQKNWPVSRWNRFSEIMRGIDNVKVIAFGKSMKNSYSRHVTDNLSGTVISAIDKTSLKEAAALIKRCSIFVGPDSSLLHIASCLKVESIGLYGPTPANYVYPYFHKVGIIMQEEKEPWMLCQEQQHNCPCFKESLPAKCMRNIEVDVVAEAVNDKMGLCLCK